MPQRGSRQGRWIVANLLHETFSEMQLRNISWGSAKESSYKTCGFILAFVDFAFQALKNHSVLKFKIAINLNFGVIVKF